MSILASLFRYGIYPLHPGAEDGDDGHIFDAVSRIEVAKMSHSPFTLTTVLVVKFKNTPERESGREAHMQQIRDAASNPTYTDIPVHKVYWIGVIGPFGGAVRRLLARIRSRSLSSLS